MNILSRVTWKAMLQNKTRTVVTIIGIILSAAMFMAVLTLAFSLRDFMLRGTLYENGDYYVHFSRATDEQLAALKEDERVSSVANVQIHGFFPATYAEETPGYTNTFILASTDQTYFDTMPVRLIKGRLPENSSEIVVSEYILTRLEKGSGTVQLGDTIELSVSTAPEYFIGFGLPLSENKDYSVSYTLVGVIEDIPNVTNLMVEVAFTHSDSNVPATLFNQMYAKTYDPSDAYDIVSEGFGVGTNVNSDILMLNGVTEYSNLNILFIAICAVLIIIIMVGSVSLIYNAFSISVSERTKQFGLLSSVGATRKQIRHSVFFEAGVLCLFAIPLGILCGWGGIAVVLHLLKDNIAGLFNYGSAVSLYAVLSLPGALGAAVIGVLTVLISAWIPSLRATRVTPVAAIRQTGDYKAKAKQVKVSKLTYKLFGLPGVMAKKYYSVSRKKYRNTIISLAISVVLFISAAAFGSGIRTTAEETTTTHYFDMVCHGISEERQEVLKELVQLEGIEEYVWLGSGGYDTILALEDTDEIYLQYQKDNLTLAYLEGRDYLSLNITVCYVEDAKLEQWLKAEGINPAPYLESEDPLALVLELSGYTYSLNENGENERYSLSAYPVRDSVTELPIYDGDTSWLEDVGLENTVTYDLVTEDGRMAIHVISIEEDMQHPNPNEIITDTSVGKFFVMELGENEIRYYPYDPDTDTTVQEPTAVVPTAITSVKLGARVEDMYYSNITPDFHGIDLVLPLSAMPVNDGMSVGINIKTGNAEAVRSFLDENDVAYSDYLAREQQIRGILTVVDVFSYGFIILISLICVANVFNTISTNIALRRRDFGMLRSTGMQTKELYRMMNYECLIYGSKALLWGLPISILLSYGIHLIFSTASAFLTKAFTPPWSAILIATVCVFLVVFISMFYAVSKLRKDNPIEAIRMENT